MVFFSEVKLLGSKLIVKESVVLLLLYVVDKGDFLCETHTGSLLAKRGVCYVKSWIA